jgi:hypothetical protein
MTDAEQGVLAPGPESSAFVTLHRGAQDDVAVQPPAPFAKVPLMAVAATSDAVACAGAKTAAASAAAKTIRRVREGVRMAGPSLLRA